ncbi:MAG: hypothetical protein JO033_11395 [Acidobacteriaceae bacterium]|nr:hypothetical protein [Acidobacteriaceae bacterium]
MHEPVKYEVGALIRSLLGNPYDARIQDPRRTSLYSGDGKLATRLPSGYRVLWDIPDGSTIVLWDILPPVGGPRSSRSGP